ncbi:MAG: CRISPR-associated endonuclease Cas2 [Clostridium sp.]|nr:CRISPR-associated endonuclease Cas2 [Clostridium sp.]
MYAILVYDIVTDTQGKKNLPNVFKICKKYLSHIQNSVFEGNITEAGIIALKAELKSFIRKEQDSVILFTARDERWLKKEFLGCLDDKTSRFI